MILDENLFEMVAKKEHKKPSARERRKVLESILIEKKLISKKLKESTLTSKGIDGSEMSFDIKDDGTITIYNNGKVVKQSKTDPEYARKVLKDLGFKEKETIKTESVEGDEIAQATIDSKNINFEKDKENDRQVKLELAKQGVVKEELSSKEFVPQWSSQLLSHVTPRFDKRHIWLDSPTGRDIIKFGNKDDVETFEYYVNMVNDFYYEHLSSTRMNHLISKDVIKWIDIRDKDGFKYTTKAPESEETWYRLRVTNGSPYDFRHIYIEPNLKLYRTNETEYEYYDGREQFDFDKYNRGEYQNIDESLKEDLSQEEQQEYGLNTLINQLIKSEYDAIDDYNSAIVTLEAEGQGEYTDVIRSIIEDERHHIGNLQEIMDRITPGTTSEFEKGKEEAEETLGEEETKTTIDTEEGVIKTYKLDSVEDMK